MTMFLNEAIAFVREHNCAMHTPAELIQEAMLDGATIVLKRETKLLQRLHAGQRNGGEKSGTLQPE